MSLTLALINYWALSEISVLDFKLSFFIFSRAPSTIIFVEGVKTATSENPSTTSPVIMRYT
jgi:hypothetical protein